MLTRLNFLTFENRYDFYLKFILLNINFMPQINQILLEIYISKKKKVTNISLIIEILMVLFLIFDYRPLFIETNKFIKIKLLINNSKIFFSFLEFYNSDLIQRDKQFRGINNTHIINNKIHLTSFYLGRFRHLSGINPRVFEYVIRKKLNFKIQINTNTQNIFLNLLLLSNINYYVKTK